jgi:mRNA interferase RelE/StbE
MNYQIGFKPCAMKDLQALSKAEQRRILLKVERLRHDLAGDVKKLTNFTPEYRLRVGDYWILFDVVGEKVSIYRILHRRDAYS